MADAIKFPGTEMEVIEKYSLSRRLDHPDFGDVCKTTFAVGTITDFKKTVDDPITVEPMVKVTGDFGESEYIPIFYHPKVGYWDGTDVLATDFDEETGAFKQAWQTFRGGDEVAVMLKEGVPVAVMGFADGVPRIGEDIVKVSTKSIVTSFDYGGNTDDDKIINKTWPDAYFQISQAKMYEEAEKGLDGLDLKLILPKAECYKSTEFSEASSSWLGAWGGWPDATRPVPPVDAPFGTFTNCEGFCEIPWLGLGNASSMVRNVGLWIVKVGPIVYAIFGMWFQSRSVSVIGYLQYDDPGPTIFGGLFVSTQNIYGIERLMVKAAVYKEDLLPGLISSLDNFTPEAAYALGGSVDWWPVTPEEFIYQRDLSVKFRWLTFFDAKSLDEVEWFTRPHTKEELTAAGMWPAA